MADANDYFTAALKLKCDILENKGDSSKNSDDLEGYKRKFANLRRHREKHFAGITLSGMANDGSYVLPDTPTFIHAWIVAQSYRKYTARLYKIKRSEREKWRDFILGDTRLKKAIEAVRQVEKFDLWVSAFND